MAESYLNSDHTLQLSREHRHMLFEESGIDPSVADERRYRTITRRDELTEYPEWQRRLGLYVPNHSPDGVTVQSQLRPNKPRRGGPKYESPYGSSVILDVHPRMIHEVRHGTGELDITEGVKTGDSNTSRGRPTVVLNGVWGWKVAKTHDDLLPDWDYVNLYRRPVNIIFDGDVMTKWQVQQALDRFVPALEERGADVRVVYLPDEMGLDDFYAAGYSVAEFKMLARKYEQDDIGNIRLSQDDQLRGAIEAARASWWSNDWNRVTGTGERPDWRRGHTARDVEHAAIERTTKGGVVVEDGIYFTLDIRSWSLAAAKSKPAVIKAINNLEAEGRIRRHEGKRGEGQAAGYVLLTARAVVDHNGRRKSGGERADSLDNVASDRSGKGPRVPRLRWSVNRQPARRGLIRGTRKPRQYRFPGRESIIRLGPNRGAVVDALDKLGGSATLRDLAEVLNKPRPRDLARRATTEKSRDGLLIALEDSGIVELDGDTVSLSADWRRALLNARIAGGEADDRHKPGAETRDRNRYRRQRENYRNRHKVQVGTRYIGAENQGKDERGRDKWATVDAGFEVGHWTSHPEADGALEDLQRPEEILSESDRRALECIKAYEHRFGAESFGWDRASCKRMFYQLRDAPWPEPDQLDRIQSYLKLTTGAAA